MGSRYDQLSLEERCRIAELRRSGQSLRQIAAALDREPSTISRELKRNTGQGPRAEPYRPTFAQQKADARRWTGSRLERDDALRDQVLTGLARGWSPAQVVGRLKRETGRTLIGCETIYRFIHAQMKRTNDGAWRHFLPRAKSRRGWRTRPGGSPASFIKDRIPLSKRSPQALDRTQPGHWEADFMLFSRYGQNLLVLHERTSRFTAFVKTPDRKARPTAERLAGMMATLPKRLRRTLTFDNGTEFAEHHRLNQDLAIQTFFCDPHAPWQKGGVENAIGRMRRFLPRRTNLDTLSTDQITACAMALNHTPRKCLDFQTPAEVLSKALHFKRDSSSPLSRG
ncbi:IS30 family transposase [Brevundimonas sp.]|uniref:IS30 family transposase n=1 Tax=Brevundimonas sp. TaxID=1871086 RepID=UPI002AC8F455|nr:IS30 family transposase [Brevundimonas sp.]